MPQDPSSKPTPDQVKQAASKIADYFGGYFATWTVDLGIRTKLFHKIGEHPEGITSEALAREMGLNPMYVDVWCRNAYGAELLELREGRYVLTPSMAYILLDRDSPAYAAGTAQALVGLRDVLASLREWMKTGERIWWDTAPHEFVDGVAESTRPFYTRLLNLTENDPIIREKLVKGGTLLEVGVGYGNGLIRFAAQYPNAKMIGVDGDAYSLEQAKLNFVRAKMDSRVSFVISNFEDYKESGVADVALINVSLHEARDIGVAIAGMYRALKPDGVIIVSEFPYPEVLGSLRTPPARVMSGIQYFEAMIGDQLLPIKEFVALLTKAGFKGIKTVDLAPVHAAILGHKIG